MIRVKPYAYGLAHNLMGRFAYTGQIQLPEIQLTRPGANTQSAETESIQSSPLYHYKARSYHPTLGRFLQTDPVGYEDQINLYAYVGNDPVNMVDPSGEFGVVGFAIGFGIELGDQLLSGKKVSLEKAAIMGIAGALTGGIASFTKSSVTIGGKVIASTGQKVAAGFLVTGTATTLSVTAGAVNDSLDGYSSNQITENMTENAIEGVAPHVKAVGKIAGKLSSKLGEQAKQGQEISETLSEAVSAAAEKNNIKYL